MEQVLDHNDKNDLPTAFVAVGALQAIKRHGYGVPEDFSSIGFDDRPICTMVEPKLSTVRLPKYS